MAEIVLPAGTKMRLLATARDAYAQGEISALDFLVLFTIHDQADRATGYTAISHAELARLLACTPRAAERSTKKLVGMHHLQVERNKVGRRQNGSLVFGSRNGKNLYRLIFKRPTPGSVLVGETPTGESVLEHRLQKPRRPTPEAKKTDSRVGTLYSLDSSHKNLPSRAPRARGAVWANVFDRLAARLGLDQAESWFGRLSTESIEGEIVTMRAPSKFLKSHIEGAYSEPLLFAWKVERPNVRTVRIVVNATPSADAEPEQAFDEMKASG